MGRSRPAPWSRAGRTTVVVSSLTRSLTSLLCARTGFCSSWRRVLLGQPPMTLSSPVGGETSWVLVGVVLRRAPSLLPRQQVPQTPRVSCSPHPFVFLHHMAVYCRSVNLHQNLQFKRREGEKDIEFWREFNSCGIRPHTGSRGGTRSSTWILGAVHGFFGWILVDFERYIDFLAQYECSSMQACGPRGC